MSVDLLGCGLSVCMWPFVLCEGLACTGGCYELVLVGHLGLVCVWFVMCFRVWPMLVYASYCG